MSMRTLSIFILSAFLLSLSSPVTVGADGELCISASVFLPSAPVKERLCCQHGWITDYFSTNGSYLQKPRTYCRSEEWDIEILSNNGSWYQHCSKTKCPSTNTICCLADGDIAPPPLPSTPPPPPPPVPGAAILSGAQLPTYALQMCPGSSAGSFFGYNTYKAATPTQAPACPTAEDSGTAVASEQSFTLKAGESDRFALERGEVYVLTIFRKAALGPVTLTLSAYLDGLPDAVVYDKKTITLSATASATTATANSTAANTAANITTANGTAANNTTANSTTTVATAPVNTSTSTRNASTAAFQAVGKRLLGHGLEGVGEGEERLEASTGRKLHRGGVGRRRRRSQRSNTKYRGSSYVSYSYTSYSDVSTAGYRRPLMSELVPNAIYAGVFYEAIKYYRSPNVSSLVSNSTVKTFYYPSLDYSKYQGTLPYGLPLRFYTLFTVNPDITTAASNDTTGVHGPSVYTKGQAFQYSRRYGTEPTKCADCGLSATCCSKPYNNTWPRYSPDQATLNRTGNTLSTGTTLSCDLDLDFVLEIPFLIPTNADNLTITIHSIQAKSATTACGNASQLVTAEEPAMYFSLLRADRVNMRLAMPTPPPASPSGAGVSAASGLILVIMTAAAAVLVL